MERKTIAKNYLFLAVMLGAMVLGAMAGWLWPATETSAGATVLKPLGTVFINMMFCIVVPMVFASISSAVANMESGRGRSWASPWGPSWSPAPLPPSSCMC